MFIFSRLFNQTATMFCLHFSYTVNLAMITSIYTILPTFFLKSKEFQIEANFM